MEEEEKYKRKKEERGEGHTVPRSFCVNCPKHAKE